MRRPEPALSRAIAVVASAAALASAAGGAWVGVPKLDDWRGPYGPLPGSLRDDPVALFLGFDVESWDALRRSLREGDRYRRRRRRIDTLRGPQLRRLRAPAGRPGDDEA